jgi:branched-chain amino acid aminotransferase
MAKAMNWDELTFDIHPAPWMYIAKAGHDGKWSQGEITPYGDLTMSPAACILNYGQGLFEGLKALRTRDGNIVLFRHKDNGMRLADGAKRACIPPFPVEQFTMAVESLVRRNSECVPPYGKGSLYIRPCLWGTGAVLGVKPAPEYMFVMFMSPVGTYFKGGMTPIKLEVYSGFHRSAPKGMGHIKYVGNYTGGMLPAIESKSRGFNECLYLDAREEKYIEEVGTANFFALKGNCLMTPQLGSILPGITRRSVVQLAREKLGMTVEERKVSIDEAICADEAFCTGTAAVVSPIGSIFHHEKDHILNGFKVGAVTKKLYDLLTRIQLMEEKDSYGWVTVVK